MRRNRRGFTLVEIIVVLVILAILTAIAVPTALGYVDDAKEARELAKLRESLIAAQMTFVKSTAFGEIGKGVNNETGSKNYYLTDNQSESIQKYLDTKPYVLIYGIDAPSYYGETSKEASNVYCIIYQKIKIVNHGIMMVKNGHIDICGIKIVQNPVKMQHVLCILKMDITE